MDRNISQITFLGTILILFLFGVWFLLIPKKSENTVHIVTDEKIYTSQEFGFSFSYPTKYFLEEKEVPNGERRHFAIILTEDTEENRLVREGKSSGRDGSVAITFDVYQNNLAQITLLEWLLETNDSNYQLSKGPYATTTLAGLPAFTYEWSGLYEGETKAFVSGDTIIAASVTFLSPDERIRKDFEEILKNFKSN